MLAKPIPPFDPVTMMTLPWRSGSSWIGLYVEEGGAPKTIFEETGEEDESVEALAGSRCGYNILTPTNITKIATFVIPSCQQDRSRKYCRHSSVDASSSHDRKVTVTRATRRVTVHNLNSTEPGTERRPSSGCSY